MKKILLILIIIFLYFLSSCSLNSTKDYSEEHLDFKERYMQYISNDIESFDNFNSFVTEVTFTTSLSSVRVEVNFFGSNDNLVETRHGSGVAFEESEFHIYILTAMALSYTPEELNSDYVITNSEGVKTSGDFIMTCESSKLMILRVSKGAKFSLPVLDIANYSPVLKEPILLMGYQKQVLNAKSMGLYLHTIDKESEFSGHILTNIPTDLFGNGGGVINIRHEIVGLQIGVKDQKTVTATLPHILNFIEQFNQKGAVGK